MTDIYSRTALGFSAADAWRLKYRMEKLLTSANVDWSLQFMPLPDATKSISDAKKLAQTLNGEQAFKIFIDDFEVTVYYYIRNGWLQFLLDATVERRGKVLKFSDTHHEEIYEAQGSSYGKKFIPGKEFDAGNVTVIVDWIIENWRHPLESEMYREILEEFLTLLTEHNPYSELRWQDRSRKRTSYFIAYWEDPTATMKAATRRERSFAKYMLSSEKKQEIPAAEQPLELDSITKFNACIFVFNFTFFLLNLLTKNWGFAAFHGALAAGCLLMVSIPLINQFLKKSKAGKEVEVEENVQFKLKSTESELAKLLR